MTSQRAGARSVSRASTPSEAGDWQSRLRARPDESPMPSPTKVGRSRAPSARVLKGSVAGSTAGSVAPSIVGSDVGSVNSVTRGHTSGSKSRNARAGTSGNTYGTTAAAQSSQMTAGQALTGLSAAISSELRAQTSAAMSSELQVETWAQRTEPQRFRDDREDPNPERPFGPGIPEGTPDYPNRFLEPVREESEGIYSSKSYGPFHEYGMGQTGTRNKSFSDAHEAGIAGKSQLNPNPFSTRNSPSSRSSSAGSEVEPVAEPVAKPVRARTQAPASQERYGFGAPRSLRFYPWYLRNRYIILRSLLLLPLFGTLLYMFGTSMLEQGKQLVSSASSPAVTVTSPEHVHKTTTITHVIKETSVMAVRSSIEERRNYFNMEIGATIDSRLTSITRAPMTLVASVFGPLYGSFFAGPIVNQADTALRPWTETGQSWCAATSDLGQGQLQLGVSLPFTVRPLAITLEHQPRDLSFDRDNSARNVQLWVETQEDSTGVDLNVDCGPKPEGMDKFWLCVAKMEFRPFNGEEKAQRIEFRNEHVYTNHVAFRVTNNWGSDHTCLYRVQLHGLLKVS